MTGGYHASFVMAAGFAAAGMVTFWMVPTLHDVRRRAREGGGGAGNTLPVPAKPWRQGAQAELRR
jgi:hypothetical protein